MDLFEWEFVLKVLVRSVVAVLLGALIGSEREKHGRAAGMRTHTLVCLGAALTSMIGVFVSEILGNNGDILRISAQVISGIGFLGAGMIILKSNNMITGLTTAAGVWTTSIVGIAVGYGFYSGAIISTALLLSAIVFFSRFEKKKKTSQVIYIEIDDMYKTNEVLKAISQLVSTEMSHMILAPKSSYNGHLGISIILNRRLDFEIEELCKIENIVFVEEE